MRTTRCRPIWPQSASERESETMLRVQWGLRELCPLLVARVVTCSEVHKVPANLASIGKRERLLVGNR